jgi:hypothetical protein
LAEEVLGSNKILELFQVMAMVSRKMDNLGFKIIIKNHINHSGGGKTGMFEANEIRAISTNNI